MRIECFAVRNDFLRKYIDYYYLLSTVGDKQNTEYLAFPSGITPVGFFRNASLSQSPKKTKMKFLASNSLRVLLVGNFLRPLNVEFEPGITELAVVFKPLGINHFIEKNLGAILSKDVTPVEEFDDFSPLAKKLIDGVDAFDEFEDKLISRFSANKQIKLIETITTNFRETEVQSGKRQMPAVDVDVSGKQLFRLFKKHLGVSPTQFRQLLRFRAALDLTLKNLETQNLTEIGFCAGYYDQPHFIKEFKKLTNLAPRNFLKRISLEADDKIAWQFLAPMSESYN